jgi:hypothetical protein
MPARVQTLQSIAQGYDEGDMATAQPTARRRRVKRKSLGQLARACLRAGLSVLFAVFVGVFVVGCIVTRTIAVSAWQLVTLIFGPAPTWVPPSTSDVTVHLPAGVITRIAPTS